MFSHSYGFPNVLFKPDGCYTAASKWLGWDCLSPEAVYLLFAICLFRFLFAVRTAEAKQNIQITSNVTFWRQTLKISQLMKVI